ncbi:T9SS type A sorting domain-containing protein [candidate division KSB1 bacterium]
MHNDSNTKLHKNYPNPFNPVTTIRAYLPQPADVTLKVYNILGQEVATLIDNERRFGEVTAQWDASGMASGIYLYRLTAGKKVKTGRMLLMK